MVWLENTLVKGIPSQCSQRHQGLPLVLPEPIITKVSFALLLSDAVQAPLLPLSDAA